MIGQATLPLIPRGTLTTIPAPALMRGFGQGSPANGNGNGGLKLPSWSKWVVLGGLAALAVTFLMKARQK